MPLEYAKINVSSSVLPYPIKLYPKANPFYNCFSVVRKEVVVSTLLLSAGDWGDTLIPLLLESWFSSARCVERRRLHSMNLYWLARISIYILKKIQLKELCVKCNTYQQEQKTQRIHERRLLLFSVQKHIWNAVNMNTMHDK